MLRKGEVENGGWLKTSSKVRVSLHINRGL
jgi:hypothetical protein